MAERPTVDVAVPSGSLVVLVGASGSGKSSFALSHFLPTEVLSSDRFRAMLADDEADQSVSGHAFELLYTVARLRLELGRLTVVDATSTTLGARAALLAVAREAKRPVVAIVLDVPVRECLARNASRAARVVDESVVLAQAAALTDSLPEIGNEGFDHVYLLRGTDEVDRVRIVRGPKIDARS